MNNDDAESVRSSFRQLLQSTFCTVFILNEKNINNVLSISWKIIGNNSRIIVCIYYSFLGARLEPPIFRIGRFSMPSSVNCRRDSFLRFDRSVPRVEKRNEHREQWNDKEGRKECLPRVSGLSSHYRSYLFDSRPNRF